MNVQESVHIFYVVIFISNKHTCLSSVIQLGSHLLAFMYGNHCHFSKCSKTSSVICIFPIEQCMRGFVLSVLTIMLSNFVAVEMTSHQNSPLYFDSIPAWISTALALPINVGILLSATEFCWDVAGAVNSKVIPRLALSHSFCRLLFSPLLSSVILLISMLCFFDKILIQMRITWI